MIFGRDGALLARPFALEQLRSTGPAVPVLQDVDFIGSFPLVDFSENGILVYQPARKSTLVWMNRHGAARQLSLPPDHYAGLRLSPDGSEVLLEVIHGIERDIWVGDLRREVRVRLRLEGRRVQSPVWAPDGGSLAFASTPDGGDPSARGVRGPTVHRQAVHSQGGVEMLHPEPWSFPAAWSPDGKFLAYADVARGYSISFLPMEGDVEPPPLQTGAQWPAFHPEGRWIAYQSDESGAWIVYVQRFPEGGARQQISSEGGTPPLCSRDGSELFYRDVDRVMAVAVKTEPTPQAGAPELLFESRAPAGATWDVHPDGERFLMIVPEGRDRSELRVVLDWFEELKRLVPTDD